MTELDLQEFRLLLGDDRVVTDPSDVAPHNIDWLRNLRLGEIVIVNCVPLHFTLCVSAF